MCVPHRTGGQATSLVIITSELSSLMQTTTTGETEKKSLHKRAISYLSFHHIGIEQSHANNNHRRNKQKGAYTTSGQATSLFITSGLSSLMQTTTTGINKKKIAYTTSGQATSLFITSGLSSLMQATTTGKTKKVASNSSFSSATNQWNLLTRKYKI